MWFVCAFTAHTGRKSALEPPPQYAPQAKPTGRPNQPTSVITVTTADSHVTSFDLKGKITTNLNVADLLIIYDIQPFHDQFQTIKREISKLPPTVFYPERMHVINREVAETERLINVHDHLLRELDRRGIWGPFAIISGLFAGGISISAMAEAHSAKNRISDLEVESSRIFHAHSLAINDHAQQLSNITSNQAFMAKQISRSSSLLYAIKVKDEINDFQAKVKDRNRAISDMITGKFPMNTFSDQLASAVSRLLKKVHSKGFSTIEDLKPMDFTKLPFSVSHHGDSKYVLHIHVPIFRSPTTDIMNVYEHKPIPWLMSNEMNHSVIATPIDPQGRNAIAIPDHDEKSDLHQVFKLSDVDGCPRFKDIYLCPSKDIFMANYRDSCIGSLYFADSFATAQRCELIPADFISTASKISNTRFRLVINRRTTFRVKDNQAATPRSLSLEFGIYDIRVPQQGWLKSRNLVIQPAGIQPHLSVTVVGYLPANINHAFLTLKKIPDPFHPNDRQRMENIAKSESKVAPVTVTVEPIMELHHAQYLLVIMSVIIIISNVGIAVFCVWANTRRNRRGNPPQSSPSDSE